MGWYLSLTDLWTSGGRFKITTGIGVLKAKAPGPSTTSSVEKSSKVVSD